MLINHLITPTDDLICPTDPILWDEFFIPMHHLMYQAIPSTSGTISPCIDYDAIKSDITVIASTLTPAQIGQLLKGSGITAKNWRDAPAKVAVERFLLDFPDFAHLLCSYSVKADTAILAAEHALGVTTDATNFISVKSFLDGINRQRWSLRNPTDSEKQSGVSNLGTTSERLLEKVMASMIDGENFFKVENNKVNSYGDFVLMCLPNNLWLSVKSNFARERLLASGFTTDIIGVGFFTDKDEFTSQSKIRNFQRSGFLAMYIPDQPVSEAQLANNTNTYDEVLAYYNEREITLPKNINGTDFLRKLSTIGDDMQRLLNQQDISKRLAMDL